MKAFKSTVVRALPIGAWVEASDNSGAKMVKLISVVGYKGVHGRKPEAAIGDLCYASVVKGKPDIRKTVVPVIIIRTKKAFRRPDGIRVQFESNAVIVLKDEQGNPKGTICKGPMAKEISERWPLASKIGRFLV